MESFFVCFGSAVEQIVALSSGLQGWQKLNVETTLSHKFLEKLSRNFQVSRGNHVRNQSFSKVSRETFEKLPSFSRHLREKLKFLTSFSRNLREKPTKFLQTLDAETFRLLYGFSKLESHDKYHFHLEQPAWGHDALFRPH